MRVVLDTNILVSACWKPDGLEDRVVRLAMEGAIMPCVTAEIVAEYSDVLGRKKLASVQERAHEVLEGLSRKAVMVEAGARVSASIDDDDNRFLECAAAANADCLITGNLRHYPGEFGTTSIVNARQFFEAWEPRT